MSDKLKVFEFAGFPNPTRIKIALAEKGLSETVDFVSVNVMEGEHKESEYLAKNPSGMVPALELQDGTVISECTAITEYLDAQNGTAALTGKTAKHRAVIHMMQRRAEADLLDAVGGYFHHATPGLGPDIEGQQCTEWGVMQKTRAEKGIRYFDGVLATQPYVAGEEFSMADITVFAGLSFADFANIDIPQDCKNLTQWRSRMAERPSIAGLGN